MLISKSAIESYIPQRTPFIMVDNLVAASLEKFETDFQVLPDNIFMQNGLLREFALIENIAQSSSLGLAVLKMTSGKKTIDGFIGGISKLKLFDLPRVNDIIQTFVVVVAQLENMFLVRGDTFVNGRKMLECEIKLVGV